MDQNERGGLVVGEGGRSPSALSTGHGGPGVGLGPLAPGQIPVDGPYACG